jgi:phospholipase C
MEAKRRERALGVILAATLAAALGAGGGTLGRGEAATTSPAVAVLTANPARADMNKIKHMVFIVQENRSFDEYFGMYPGADGIPVDSRGRPTVCVPDPKRRVCVAPFHDPNDVSSGGPHGRSAALNDVNGGQMNGFISTYEDACAHQHGTSCKGAGTTVPDLMGYKLRADIPNYWAYADNYVLQDHLFEPLGSWSQPAHLALVSGWSALCYEAGAPMSCRNEPDNTAIAPYGGGADYAWTNVTYLLDRASVSWAYYVFTGKEPDCSNPDALNCVPAPQDAKTPSIWNPMARFDDVRSDGKVGNVQSISNLIGSARAGRLPSVSWVIPTHSVSEHPPSSVRAGQEYVTYVVNQLMQSPEWKSTAIFLTWDDWGGFYDHRAPPTVDENGYGIRNPALLISPYSKTGYIDHQTLSTDAYLRLIEDRFVGGQRIDPATDGRADNRPDVRENAPQLGNLLTDFDFTQAPKPPLILPTVAASKLATPFPQPANGQTFTTLDDPPTVGAAPFAMQFDGSRSHDPAGIASWSLTFGDGGTAKGNGAPPSSIPHTYASVGSFTATLTVSDHSGFSGRANQRVTVTSAGADRATWITATPIVGYAPQPVLLDGSQSAPGDWAVNFGDGSAPVHGTGVPPAALLHTYQTPANYTQTLTVFANGVTTTAQSRITIVASAAPIARTTGVTAVKLRSAQVAGHVLPNSAATVAWFVYGTAADRLDQSTPAQYIARGEDVYDRLDHLSPGITYYVAIRAKDPLGTVTGHVLSFTTKG